MRGRAIVALGMAAALAGGCGGESEPPALAEAEDVRTCLEQSGAPWGEIPLSDFAVGNTDPGERVILVERGNVLVSWANAPSDEQERIVRGCAGVA